MKKRIGFMMPRLIGATVVVGVAALVITTLFKLMLGLVILGGAFTLISKAAMRRKYYSNQYAQNAMPLIGNRNEFNNSWTNQAQPISGRATRKASTIVPID